MRLRAALGGLSLIDAVEKIANESWATATYMLPWAREAVPPRG
jgi:hypothetical protein